MTVPRHQLHRACDHRRQRNIPCASLRSIGYATWLPLVACIAILFPTTARSHMLDPSGLDDHGLPSLLVDVIADHPRQARIESLLTSLTEQRHVLDTPGASVADRRNALETRDAVHRELAELIDHPLRAIWLVDAASDIYLHRLNNDSDVVMARYGLPTARQRAFARALAESMHTLAAEAERELEDAMLAYESQPGYTDRIELQVERRRVDDAYRRQRLPVLRGVAALLHARFNLDDDAGEARRNLFQLAAESLERGVPAAPAALQTRVRLDLAEAYTHLDRFDEARAACQAVLAEAASPLTRLLARIGLVRIEAEAASVSAALDLLDRVRTEDDHADQLAHQLLLADQRYMLLMRRATALDGARRRQVQRDAFAAHADLLDRTFEGVSRATLREIVFERLALTVDEDAPLDDLPAMVTVARADQIATTVADDPSALDAALHLYAQARERQDADAAAIAAAHFGQATALLAAGHVDASLEQYLIVARDFAGHRDAARAVEQALQIAVALHQRAPDDADAQQQLRDVLAVRFAQYPDQPGNDRWRLTAARLALQMQDFDAAQSHLDHIERLDAAESTRLEAQMLAVTVERERMRGQSSPAARRRAADDLRDRVEKTIDTFTDHRARVSDAALRDRLDTWLVELRIDLAEAWLAVDEPGRAVDALADLTLAAGMPGDLRARLLRTHVQALSDAGQRDDALRMLDALLTDTGSQATGTVLLDILVASIEEIERLQGAGRDEDAVALARRDAVPIAIALSDWLSAASQSFAHDDRARRSIADALRHAHRYTEAMAIYDALLDENPAMLEAAFGRAECLFGLGSENLTDAMQLYRTIAAARRDAHDRYFWAAESRMLQILDRVDRNTHQIQPRIERLRLTDPQLGGEPYRSRFEALAASRR